MEQHGPSNIPCRVYVYSNTYTRAINRNRALVRVVIVHNVRSERAVVKYEDTHLTTRNRFGRKYSWVNSLFLKFTTAQRVSN